MPSAHSNEHTNAEASPSNLALPLTSYVATPPTNPPGGTSEASADAENIQTTTEENAVPVSNLYCSRFPHVVERVFSARRPGAAEAQGTCVHGSNGTRPTFGGYAAGRKSGRGSEGAQVI